ncbi:J domain-containing protein [Candidatus Saccharibacteria bacterium]|nr:J domain-containing protein [Candidatus Saccharibacteria bacterium]
MSVRANNPNADFYVRLEVDEDCTSDQLKASYRRLAHKLHPDTNPDPVAAEQFKLVCLAYETLGDPSRRAEYDQLRQDHYLSQPPILRLSEVSVDFGSVRAGEKVDRVVYIYNDGGDGVGENLECTTSPISGPFWLVDVAGLDDSDPADAIGKLVFTTAVGANELASAIQQEILIHLISRPDVSSRTLGLKAEVIESLRVAPASFGAVTFDHATGVSGTSRDGTSAPYRPYVRSGTSATSEAPRMITALVACLAYICGPFLTIYYVVNGGHASAPMHSAWQGLVTWCCFGWLTSCFLVVPIIWEYIVD